METLFLAICGFLALGILMIAGTLKREALILLIALGGIDLLLQGILADKGFFEDFSTMPPRIAVALLPNILLLAFFTFRKGVGIRLSTLPASWLVGFQAFRIAMEWILYSLVQSKSIPDIMTFSGSNFDILIGLTAPFVAFSLLNPDPTKIKIAIGWNILGLAILSNTVAHGLLAAPTPFQVFHTDPANTLIAQFPWIWLPAFVVPVALLGHILSIRQLKALVSTIG